ncbi:quinol:cytochrome C oxidoreductase [Stratiformator vulcanicus]|uniref:Quinol:cytochrome C oxidoreductase n=1 Tax=Stratiformator vulcanicus TaxID=2527980 RepID=A0A517R2X5_9PLAN|nr:quinol:cytochrome C oxidoreductase [Stratiformator vulcanicus]QDT38228.1 hypothetical protein Pan189_26180 [Stratiformator vulcanicus]
MAHQDRHISEDELARPLGDDGTAAGRTALLIGIGGLVAAVVIAVLRSFFFSESVVDRFLFSYLHGFCFWLSIGIGALLYVMVQHVVRAGASVVVRRLAEFLAGNMWIFAILFVPILIAAASGTGVLFKWTNAGYVETHELVAHKQPYLNVPFFTVRAIFYFAVWAGLGWLMLSFSTRQDKSGDPNLTKRAERFSAVGLALVFITATFASIDWIMSLDAEWFSTMFGVYYIAGSIVAFFATMSILVVLLQERGRLTDAITEEHRHDLGKLLHGFIIFWAYIAFSQYLLIWYASIPEETTWYFVRQNNGWQYVAILLLFVHFVIPFFGLMNRASKRDPKQLMFWSVWILAAHWLDLHYLIMPNMAPEGIPLGLIDIAMTLGIGGLAFYGLLQTASNLPLVPIRDPRLKESLHFHQI